MHGGVPPLLEVAMRESASSRPRRRILSLPGLGLLLVLFTVDCNNEQRSVIKGVPPPSKFAGSWMMSVIAPKGACAFLFQQLWCCCPVPIQTEDTPGGLLVRMPSKTVMATVSGGVVTLAQETRWPGDMCAETESRVWTGVLEGDNRVSGEWTLTVTATGTCDPRLPCEDRGTFRWDRCPDSGCVSVVCPN